MKKLIIKVLILLIFPAMTYSQTDYSKDEIYKSWAELTNQTQTQSDYRFHFDSIVVNFIDSLKMLGIDTIGAYGEKYVGSYSLDSCKCGLVPWMTIVHWVDKGKTFHRKIMKCCSFETMTIDNSALISYYLNNSKSLNKERIMPNITSVSKDKNGDLLFALSIIDHTTNYLIYCETGNQYRFVKFNEYDFENKESIFYEDNNNSIIKSWQDMILNQLHELK